MNSYKKQLTNSEYHSMDGISKSKLDMIHRDPALIEWDANLNKDYKEVESVDDNLSFGEAFHTFILENDKYLERYFILPDLDMRYSKSKEIINKLKEENSHKVLIKNKQHQQIVMMAESFYAHPVINVLFENAIEFESSYFIEENDILKKIRPDFVSKIDNSIYLCDLKTISDIKNISSHIKDYRYHVQAAWYSDIFQKCNNMKVDHFCFIFVSKTLFNDKYHIHLCELDSESIEIGYQDIERDLNSYVMFNKNKKFYIPKESLPNWYKNSKIEEY